MSLARGTSLRRATDEDWDALERMYREYKAVLSGLGADVDLSEGLQRDWITKPDLFPFVILVEGRVAGMALVMGPSYVKAYGETEDYFFWDLYVDPEHRGTGVAAAAVAEVLERLPGRWGVEVFVRNDRALSFWSRVLAARARVVERTRRGDFLLHRFEC